MSEIEFVPFPKIKRLTREMIVTEKLDGTNAQITITENGDFYIGSRSRWITPEDDNYGFARWATEHKDELMQLGPGSPQAEAETVSSREDKQLRNEHHADFGASDERTR